MSENIDAVNITIVGNYTTHTNVDEVLQELFGRYNQPNSLVKLNSNGTFDITLSPPTSIDDHLTSEQSTDKSIIETTVNRIDTHIEQMKATEIFYSGDNYLLENDHLRPLNKLSYIEYGEESTDPVVALIYSAQGKLIRVDYYLDRSTFTSDGSGRSGFNSITYNNLGKLESSVFTEL